MTLQPDHDADSDSYNNGTPKHNRMHQKSQISVKENGNFDNLTNLTTKAKHFSYLLSCRSCQGVT